MVTIELRPGVGFGGERFEAKDPSRAAEVEALNELVSGAPRPAFGRPGWLLAADAGRLRGGEALPDLARFFVVDGERAKLAAHPLVASAEDDEGAPQPLKAEPGEHDLRVHERDGRGQGVVIATLVRADGLEKVAPEAGLEIVPPYQCRADAVERASADLAFGDVLLVGGALESSAVRAAARHAAARGVVVVAGPAPPAAPLVGALVGEEPATLAARAACLQSYAVGIGLGRLAPTELLAVAGFPERIDLALDALDERAAKRTRKAPLVKVTLESATIVRGGDVGDAEIYFEGWIDDGAGGRVRFRIPNDGHVPSVKNGDVIPLKTQVFESRKPVGDTLTIHVEAWDEDLGRSSLLNPDDLLGVHERRFGPDDEWGAGRHEDVRQKSDVGEWTLTYVIALL